MNEDALTFLSQQHPYDELPAGVLQDIANRVDKISVAEGEEIYALGSELQGLYIVQNGLVSVRDGTDTQVSILERGNSFGERGLLAEGKAVTSARAVKDTLLICLPAALFKTLREEQSPFQRFFARSKKDENALKPQQTTLAQVTVEQLMVSNPETCGADTALIEAAQSMSQKRISCLCVVEDGSLQGIVTLRDLVGKAMATGMDSQSAVSTIMTPDPRTLPPTAIGSDVLHLMMEYRLGHLPIVAAGKLVGIVTQTVLNSSLLPLQPIAFPFLSHSHSPFLSLSLSLSFAGNIPTPTRKLASNLR